MALGARQLITGVPRTPAQYGLFSVVTPREPSDPHWQNGVEWEVLPCRNPGVIRDPVCDDLDDDRPTGLPKNFNKTEPGLDQADPFTVYAPYRCSGPAAAAEGQDQATEMLQASEQSEVEWVIWSGHYGTQTNLPDSAEPAADVPLDPVAALAALESWYHGNYGTVNGMAGVVHMGMSAATVLASQDVLKFSGNTVTTAAGSRVIIGTGYGSAAMQDDSSVIDRMYITPPPFVYRSEIFTSSGREGDLFDRGTNDWYAVAERTYLVGWDSCPISYYVDLQWPVPGTNSDLPELPPFTIDTPADGTTVDPNETFTISGQGTPGRTVTVSNGHGAAYDQDVVVGDDATWSVDASLGDSFAGTDVTYTAVQNLRTAEVTVTVTAARKLHIASPVNNATITADEVIEVAGTGGDPELPITCSAVDGGNQSTLDEQTGIVADADGNWTASLDGTPWAPSGGYVTLIASDDTSTANAVNLEVT